MTGLISSKNNNQKSERSIWITCPLTTTPSLLEKFANRFNNRQEAIDWLYSQGITHIEVKSKEIAIASGNITIAIIDVSKQK